MPFSLFSLLTNEDGLLIGHKEVDYSQLPDHPIKIDEGFDIPFNICVIYTHRSLLKDYHRGELVTRSDITQYWTATKDELRGAGSVEFYDEFLDNI